MGAEGDGGFAMDPLGSGGVGHDVGCFVVEAGEVSVVIDEITEVVGEEVTGEGFAVLAGGPAGGRLAAPG